MKRRPIPSVQTMTQNWVNGMQAAGPKYTAGVNAAVAAGVNPGQLAAANQSGYLAGVQASVGLWAANVQRMSPQGWAQMCAQLGANNLGPAAQAKQMKYSNAMTNVVQVMTQLKQTIAAMPSNSYSARKARAIAWMDGMHALRTATGLIGQGISPTLMTGS